MFKELNEECGVFGVYNLSTNDAAKLTYYGLMALQHRGQESAGIAVRKEGDLLFYKDQGLVQNVFEPHVLNFLSGTDAIGHVRYSTTGDSVIENAQPIVRNYKEGKISLVHNGNIRNSAELKEELENQGMYFTSTTDSEIILALIMRNRLKTETIQEAILETMNIIKGGYSILMMTKRKFIAFTDPFGIRPLCYGKLGDAFVFASETSALDTVKAEFVRWLEPGEIITLSPKGMTELKYDKRSVPGRFCSFEFIYFSRPDSYHFGLNVNQARINLGKELFYEHGVNADIVIGVPESGTSAALGYYMASGIPFSQGFVRNSYVGRTFIKPGQDHRRISVDIKLLPLKENVRCKDVIMIDDSIVRGTTTKNIVRLLKNAGARKVFVMSSAPPIKYSCFYGIDTPEREHLIAANLSVDEICKEIGADGLYYLSIEGMLKAFKDANCGFCTACYDGNYPI